MPSARSLLDRGLSLLGSHFGESFSLVDVPGRTFKGLVETTTYGNTADTGGFQPEGNGLLFVDKRNFAAAGVAPFPGMRLRLRKREFVVNTVEDRFNQWGLRLEQANPKPSDVPCRIDVLTGQAGTPLGGQENNPLSPSA